MVSWLLLYMKGYLHIRIHGNSAERFLNACRYRGIRLWGLSSAQDSYEMNISIRDFKKLKPVIRKTGTKVIVLKKFGLPFYLQKHRKRKLFIIGFFLALLLFFLMTRFIWSIEIQGNLTYTDEALLEFLNTRSIHSGMKKSEIDCTEIVKDIRREYDDIIWVSAYLKGTRLMIHVKENEDSPVTVKGAGSGTEKDTEPSNIIPQDIVADRDATIESVIIREGIALVKAGDKVKKGDVLVSGLVSIISDTGEITGYQYHVSDADICAVTEMEYEDRYPTNYVTKKEMEIQKQEYFLEIGKIRLTLGDIKNKYEYFVMSGNRYHLKLFSVFEVPVWWGSRKATPVLPAEKEYSKREIQQILTKRFQRASLDLTKKGVEIIENDVKIYTGLKEASAKGSLTVRMPIGQSRPSEIPVPEEDS